MNTDELENRLRRLEPRRPSEGFAERVLAQRAAEPAIPWWRRRISIPVPALAAIVLLFIGIEAAQWWTKPASTSIPCPGSPVAIPQSNRAMADAGGYAVAMSGDCSFQLK